MKHEKAISIGDLLNYLRELVTKREITYDTLVYIFDTDYDIEYLLSKYMLQIKDNKFIIRV